MPLECTLSFGVSLQKPKIVEMDKMSEIKDAIYRIEADLDSSDSDLDREAKELKIKTRRSIRSMKNQFMKKTTFPYLARAL